MDEENKPLQEYREMLAKTPITRRSKFEWISRKIRLLIMYANIIDMHPENLSPSFGKMIKEKGLMPSHNLYEYVLLNMRTFYELAHREFKDTIEYPPTWKLVKKIRNDAIAHLSEECEDPAKLVALFTKIDAERHVIWKEYLDFEEKVFMRLKNESN